MAFIICDREMNREWYNVREFHSKFGHPIADNPTQMSANRAKIRYKWMLEEINEFIEANEIVEQADAMIDVIYFALGTLVEMGIKPDNLFEIVQDSNMAKLWPDGKPHYNEDGKTIKPPTWEDPHDKLREAIENQHIELSKVKKTYELTVAKHNFCVPAALQMILNYYGIKEMTQDKIASQLFITPDRENIEHMNWGTCVGNDTLNTFFQNNNLQLKEDYISINQFMDSFFLIEKLQELLQEETSIICGYNYTCLFGNGEDTFRHVSIIADVLPNEDRILLLDPGPKNAGYKYVSADKLFYAIKVGRDGLWCITPIKQK